MLKMLKTLPFWKTFFTTYLAIVAGIWGFGEAYVYFGGESLNQQLSTNWWVFYYVFPLFLAFSIATWKHAREEAQAESLDERNRRVMLNHVDNFWVKGVLENSLHGVALLELGIKEDPSAVNYPWTIKRESTDEALPAGKSILEIFEKIGVGRSLLILGAPGSGKTTMLLELTRQLIKRARQRESEPIPVVFHLASWTEKQTLVDWLAEQLNVVYYVPKRTAPKWINENKMLLLLDGLDEVKQDNRLKCVEAVNQFRQEYGLTSIIVCSRLEEYTDINTKLSLEGAIILQPLTSKQINAYCDKFGRSLAGVKQLLKNDKVLQELAETPLMLSIMALAYKDINPGELLASESVDEQREHLFNTYIDRMFRHSSRTSNSNFTRQQTLHYLSWLARMMIQNNIITYQIENMQPFWLEGKAQHLLYKLLIIIIPGSIGTLLSGMIITWATRLGIGFGRWFINEPIVVWLGALLIGLYIMLTSWFSEEITMVDRIKWSWEKENMSQGLSFGLVLGLFLGWSYGAMISGMILGLFLGMFLGLCFGLFSEQIEETTYPIQGLRNTLLNFVYFSIILGTFIGLLYGAGGGFNSWRTINIFLRLYVGVGTGLGIGLSFGGMSLIHHYLLRFVLQQNNLLPKHLISFLDYSVRLIFLQRIGGGYIFVHRLLMEHFASLERKNNTAQVTPSPL